MSTTPEKSLSMLISNDNSALREIMDKIALFKNLDLQLKNYLQATRPELIEHCMVANLRDGKLIIQVDNAIWATHLRFITNDLLMHFRTQGQLPGLIAIQIIVKRYVGC